MHRSSDKLKRRLAPYVIPTVVTLVLASASVASASLTFSGTSIISPATVVIDASSTVSIGTSSAQAITIGNNNSTTSFLGTVSIGTTVLSQSGSSAVAGVRLLLDSNNNLIIGNSNTGLDSFGGPGTSQNIAIGNNAFKSFGSLTANNGESVCIGVHCGELFSNSPFVTAIGSEAFENSTNSANYLTGVGLGVGEFLTTGNGETIVGHHGMLQMTTGNSNTAIGQASLYSNNTGSNNIALGWEADGYTPPDTWTMAATNGSSNLSVGTYYYKIAYVLNGVTTQLTAHSQNGINTTAGHQEVTLSNIPGYTGPMNCTATKIYRSKVNDIAQSAYYLDGTINNCNSGNSYVDSIADSSLGPVNSDPSGMIILGACGLYNGTAYKSNQLVIGCDTAPITETWIGRGVWSATPDNQQWAITGSAGINVAGKNLTIGAGFSTGNAVGGNVVISTSQASSSGSLANALAPVATFSPTSLTLAYSNMTGTQCLHEVNGVLTPTGSDCGSASASGTITSGIGGQLAWYNTTGTTVNDTGSGLTFDGTGTLTLSAGLKAPLIYPASNGTTALRVTEADGSTTIMTFDTTNGRVGIGLTPSHVLDVTSPTDSITGRFVNAASGGTGLFGEASGGGSPIGVEGHCLGNNPTSCAGVSGVNNSATGVAGWALKGASGGNDTSDYGGDLLANGAGSTNNYGVRALASGGTSGVNYGGYFSASGGTTNYGLIVASGSVGIGTITPGAVLDVNSTSSILEQSYTPPSSTSTCTTGMEAWDSNYEYRCVATNTWKRVTLSSF